MWHTRFVEMDMYLMYHITQTEKISESEHTYTENDSLITDHE